MLEYTDEGLLEEGVPASRIRPAGDDVVNDGDERDAPTDANLVQFSEGETVHSGDRYLTQGAGPTPPTETVAMDISRDDAPGSGDRHLTQSIGLDLSVEPEAEVPPTDPARLTWSQSLLTKSQESLR